MKKFETGLMIVAIAALVAVIGLMIFSGVQNARQEKEEAIWASVSSLYNAITPTTTTTITWVLPGWQCLGRELLATTSVQGEHLVQFKETGKMWQMSQGGKKILDWDEKKEKWE
ncbi:MAG: hypothetical protein Q8N55_00885 [bacterium]|nr:hypothetical protein [bacterium]